MNRRREADDDTDGRPPICPACGVTQGMVVDEGDVQFVCLECGFSDEGDRSEQRS
jgi:predicted RNA-binding Zn-ribbon protein involved in translation (DUF1610 family)